MINERAAGSDKTPNPLSEEWMASTPTGSRPHEMPDSCLTAFDSLPTLIWRANSNGKCDYFNEAWLRFTGRPLQQELGDGWLQDLHPDDRQNCQTIFREAFAAREPFEMECRLLRWDGSYRWLLDIGQPLYTPQGVFLGYVGVCYDITSRKLAEQSLARHKAILEATTDIVGMSNVDGRILYLNRAGRKLFGFEENEDVSKNQIADFHPPEVYNLIKNVGLPTATLEGTWTQETTVCTPDGQEVPLSQVIIAHHAGSGEVEYFSTIGRNITEQKRLEQAWRGIIEDTSKATGADFFKVLVRQLAASLTVRLVLIAELPDPNTEMIRTLAIWDTDHYLPDFEYALTGTPCRMVVGKELCVYPKNIQQIFPEDEILKELGVESYAGIPLFDSRHRPLGHLAVLHDAELEETSLIQSILSIFAIRAAAEIERIRLEECMRQHEARLAHVNRLHSMGEMATSLAHELNQPLAAITNYARGAIRRLNTEGKNTNELVSVLEQITSLAERAASIIEGVRSFIRKRDVDWDSVDLTDVVNEVVQLTSGALRKNNIRLELQTAKSLPSLRGDAIQLEQVALNLILNAIEAMAKVPKNKRQLQLRTRLKEANQVELSIHDNGPGLTPGLQERIFDQFVTTKTDGLGLGLSISRSIVEAHGGEMRIESSPNRGTTVFLSLPTSYRT